MCTNEDTPFFPEESGIKLTIAKLKKYKGLENISDTDAIIVIDELYKLSVLAYYIVNKKK
jgi:hypothetical protein